MLPADISNYVGLILFCAVSLIACLLMAIRLRLLKKKQLHLEQAAAELLEQQRRKHLLQTAIFDNTFQLQGLLSPDGTLLDANNTALVFAGVTRSEVIGKKFWDTAWWCHDQKSQHTLKNYVTQCAAGASIRFEATHTDASGRIRAIDATLKPLKDDHGTVIYLIPEGRDITEQKEAEAALAGKNALLETLIDSIPFDVWVRDAEGHLLLQNVQNAKHYGTKTGHTPEEDQLPEDLIRFLRIALDDVQAGNQLDLEFREDDRIYRRIIAPIRQEDQIKAILGLDINITDQHNAVRELSIGERRFKTIFEESPLAIALSDLLQGTYTAVNQSFCKLFGYSKQEIIGRSAQELELLWDQDLYQQIHRSLSDNGAINGAEIRLRTKQGELKTGKVHIKIAMIDKVTHAVTLIQDITAQKQAEEQLQASEATYRGIFDNAPIGIFQSSPAGHFISINERFATIFGYDSPEEMMNLVQDIPTQVYTDAAQRREILARLAVEETLVVDEIQFLRKDGSRFFATMYIRGNTDPTTGLPARLDGFVVDTTEHRQALELMLQHEKMLMIGGLAAGMAHEINNPLGIIAQDLQNVERRLSPALAKNRHVAQEVGLNLDALQQYLELREINTYISGMQEATRRASRIMDNMLQFSRSCGTGHHPAPLYEVIEHAVELAASDFDLRKNYGFTTINLVRDYTADLPTITINVTEIEQVLINLLKNAAQALYGRQDRTITIHAEQVDETVVISVSDNGPGMTTEVRRRVFEPFYTTKDVGKGTGLGLSVSHAIITRNHNGIITASSAPDKGSCFTITLPILQEGQR